MNTMASGTFRLFLVRQGLSPRTINQHLIRFKILYEECFPFTQKSIDTYLIKRIEAKASGSTINKYVQTIKKICELENLEWGKTVGKVRESRRPRVLLSDTEIEDLIAVEPIDCPRISRAKFKAFWQLVAYSGARPGEVLVLTVNDIDLHNKTFILRTSKTLEGRVVPIAPVIFNDIVIYLKTLKTDYLFAGDSHSSKQTHMDGNAYRKDFQKRLKALGITKGAKPYDLRHSFITRMLTDGNASLFVVQDIVGHSNAETTRRYYHGSLKEMHEALQKDPMNIASIPAWDWIKQLLSVLLSAAEKHPKIRKTVTVDDKKKRVTIVLEAE